MFWYIILTIVGASFGVTTMNKLKKKWLISLSTHSSVLSTECLRN
jgi:hypothetical protein